MNQVELNGQPHDVGPDTTVADLVRSLTGNAASNASGCAVAVNDVVVPRGDWQRGVAAGDRIEVLTAVQGG